MSFVNRPMKRAFLLLATMRPPHLTAIVGLSSGKARTRGGSSGSHTSGGDVAVHVALGPDEHDAMSRRISLVPFQLLIRNVDPGAGCEHSLAVSDDGDIVITGTLERVRLKRIGFAAT